MYSIPQSQRSLVDSSAVKPSSSSLLYSPSTDTPAIIISQPPHSNFMPTSFNPSVPPPYLNKPPSGGMGDRPKVDDMDIDDDDDGKLGSLRPVSSANCQNQPPYQAIPGLGQPISSMSNSGSSTFPTSSSQMPAPPMMPPLLPGFPRPPIGLLSQPLQSGSNTGPAGPGNMLQPPRAVGPPPGNQAPSFPGDGIIRPPHGSGEMGSMPGMDSRPPFLQQQQPGGGGMTDYRFPPPQMPQPMGGGGEPRFNQPPGPRLDSSFRPPLSDAARFPPGGDQQRFPGPTGGLSRPPLLQQQDMPLRQSPSHDRFGNTSGPHPGPNDLPFRPPSSSGMGPGSFPPSSSSSNFPPPFQGPCDQPPQFRGQGPNQGQFGPPPTSGSFGPPGGNSFQPLRAPGALLSSDRPPQGGPPSQGLMGDAPLRPPQQFGPQGQGLIGDMPLGPGQGLMGNALNRPPFGPQSQGPMGNLPQRPLQPFGSQNQGVMGDMPNRPPQPFGPPSQGLIGNVPNTSQPSFGPPSQGLMHDGPNRPPQPFGLPGQGLMGDGQYRPPRPFSPQRQGLMGDGPHRQPLPFGPPSHGLMGDAPNRPNEPFGSQSQGLMGDAPNRPLQPFGSQNQEMHRSLGPPTSLSSGPINPFSAGDMPMPRGPGPNMNQGPLLPSSRLAGDLPPRFPQPLGPNDFSPQGPSNNLGSRGDFLRGSPHPTSGPGGMNRGPGPLLGDRPPQDDMRHAPSSLLTPPSDLPWGPSLTSSLGGQVPQGGQGDLNRFPPPRHSLAAPGDVLRGLAGSLSDVGPPRPTGLLGPPGLGFDLTRGPQPGGPPRMPPPGFGDGLFEGGDKHHQKHPTGDRGHHDFPGSSGPPPMKRLMHDGSLSDVSGSGSSTSQPRSTSGSMPNDGPGILGPAPGMPPAPASQLPPPLRGPSLGPSIPGLGNDQLVGTLRGIMDTIQSGGGGGDAGRPGMSALPQGPPGGVMDNGLPKARELLRNQLSSSQGSARQPLPGLFDAGE